MDPKDQTLSSDSLAHVDGALEALLKTVATLEFDQSGSIRSASSAFFELLGLQESDLVGRPVGQTVQWADGVLPEQDGHVCFRLVRPDGSSSEMEGELRRVDSGRLLVIGATGAPALGESKQGWIDAISRSQAVIEFELDGTIVDANENFFATTGYSLEEIVGQHHRMFCEAEYAASEEYAQFWAKLGRGEYFQGEFKRVRKDGAELWLNATYNPVLDAEGKPQRVVKFASDITEEKQRAAEYAGKVNAISRSQAVIEFELDGTVVDANENFLAVTGYSLEEIVGQHHRMFCDPEYAEGVEYRDFWRDLNQGEFKEGDFQRVKRDGGRCSSARPTTRSLMQRGGHAASSSLRPTSRAKFSRSAPPQRGRRKSALPGSRSR